MSKEIARGAGYVAVAFSNDGRAAMAMIAVSKKEMEEWKKENPEYTWVFYTSERYCLTPMHEQIKLF